MSTSTGSAIVAGSASGIGLAVRDELLRRGVRVLAADVAEQGDAPEGCVPLLVDLRAGDSGTEIVTAARREFGDVSMLVNCVGVQHDRSSGFDDIDDDAWEASFQLNFMTALRCIRAALPTMREHGGGSIVSIASLAAREPSPANIDYAAFKSAMITAHSALARETAADGIRLNTVSPGPTDTPQFRRWISGRSMEIVDTDERIAHFVAQERRLPRPRLGTAQEIADTVAFLLSDAASGISGANIRVDAAASVSA